MDFSNPTSESESTDKNLCEQTNQGLKEPVAIVGIGCRFPGGASSPKAFWNMIRRKKDAIVDVPGDRWDIRRFYDENPDKPGKMYVKQGGFLKEKIDRFDPLFFGISPREAESMDPQQRLLLEVTWEAFEDGGLVESELKGSRTGVFIGGFCMDSMLMRFGQLNRELANSHSAASSTMTMLSNRISYAFDLKGPSVTMDTACSSSLVATHYGCQSIWNGDSETAIVGGVNVMLRPEFPIVMSKGKFLSPHGRCKAFDEDAAGYARGEGAGVVILKPLSAALKNRDRIYGLIKETGVNQDGHTAGITLPSSEAQGSLAREVYRKAGVDPSEIEYVEAHGTGTQAGDPAEINALDKALGEGRDPEGKCYVGSVKTNIGHLEAAAGVAGLIKAVLSLHHETILPNLHFKNPNPKISWDDTCIKIPTSEVAWKRGERVRYAGVNSFGYGGTNAHALLQEAPAQADDSDEDIPSRDRPLLLPISARSEDALRELAGKYAFFLATNSDGRFLANFCHTTASRRTHHGHRAAVLADDVETLRTRLQQFSAGEVVEQLSMDLSDNKRAAKLVFVYTGMGPQWWAMGRELMETEPIFKESILKCDELFQKQSGWSILKELRASESDSRIAKTEVAQPANFVIQVGLTELWKSWGIEPYAVVGHSVGEVASAYVSGALSLKDAITVSIYRSRLQQMLAGRGGMIAVGLSEQIALEKIEDYVGVSIAAVNSPNSVTLSGESDQLEDIARALEDQGLFVRRLVVEVAYHSAQMEPIKRELLDALDGIEPRKARIPLFSTVTGGRIEGDELTADYWWQNVRQSVRFLDGIQSIFEHGCSDFLEVGPHPVLGHSIKEIAAGKNIVVRIAPSLNRKTSEQARMVESLGQLYAQGQSVCWEEVCPSGGKLVSLPSYPWQREKHWIESSESRQDRLGLGGHVFLNRRLGAPFPTWMVEVNDQFFPYLQDHVVNGQVVFPGAGYVEAGLAIGREALGGDSWMLKDLEFRSMLTVAPETDQQISVSLDPTDHRFFVHSKVSEEDAEWQLHASGWVSELDSTDTQTYIGLTELKGRFDQECEIGELYGMLERRGLEYGECFRLARQLWILDDEVLVRIEKPNGSRRVRESILSPEILDTAFHTILSIVNGNQPYVPVSVDSVIYRKQPGDSCWYHGVIFKRESDSLRANIYLVNEDGDICVELRNAYMRAVPRISLEDDNHFKQLFYSQVWNPIEEKRIHEDDNGIQYVVFSSESDFEKDLIAGLNRESSSVIRVKMGVEFDKTTSHEFEIDPGDFEGFEQLLKSFDRGRSSHFIYLWSIDSKSEPDLNEMVGHCLAIAYLARAINEISDSECFLSIVTECSQFVVREDVVEGINAISLWGLGQVVENEFENIRCQLIDLDSSSRSPSIENWIHYFMYPKSSDIAFRGNGAYGRSLERLNIEDEHELLKTIELSAKTPVRLQARNGLDAGRFRYEEDERRLPGESEIEIEVGRAYLNTAFRIYALGLPKTGKERSVMYELVGTVVATGSGVGHFRKGDRVVSIAYGLPSSLLIQPSSLVAKAPKWLVESESFIFSDFVAAYCCIDEIGSVRLGESVLILHAGSGIGFALAQVAVSAGFDVSAIVQNEDERDRLALIGLKNVEIVFDKEPIALGEGGKDRFDVVFNNAPDRDIEKLAVLLAPFGRFVDVGKSSDEGSALPKFRSNATYASFDFDELLDENPELFQSTVDKIARERPEKDFTSLPTETFAANSVSALLDRTDSIDREEWVSLNFEGENLEIVTSRDFGGKIAFRGTYLITGGNSGFGLSVAKWLAENGADRIVLVSRSGISGDEALRIVESIRSLGVCVESECVDVTDRDAMVSLGNRMEEDEHSSLKGVFHGAMVLDDGYIGDLSFDSLRKVMAPKILGALNVYEVVKDRQIDFVVNFSSISSIIGNRGQANYNAANAFLDVFTHVLRQRGIASKTINWGALSETGVVARSQQLGHLLEKEGIGGLSDAEALKALSSAMNMESNQIGIFDTDWDVWAKANQKAAKSNRFENLVSLKSDRNKEDKAVLIGSEIADLQPSEQSEFIERMVRSGLSAILKIPGERIDANQPLEDLGIDSLLLIELSLTIQAEFGVNITAAELPKFSSVVKLSNRIVNRLLKLNEQVSV